MGFHYVILNLKTMKVFFLFDKPLIFDSRTLAECYALDKKIENFKIVCIDD